MAFRVLDLGADPADCEGFSGQKYYKLATITWSRPRTWNRGEDFDVPRNWAGHGGVYAFEKIIKNEHKVVYVGKANKFEGRLNKRHSHYDLIEGYGRTTVTCGRIAFARIASNEAYYNEIEDILILTLWPHIHNVRSLSSLPGFRGSQTRVLKPWVITNEVYRFGGRLPKRIVYPAIAVGK